MTTWIQRHGVDGLGVDFTIGLGFPHVYRPKSSSECYDVTNSVLAHALAFTSRPCVGREVSSL